MSFFVGKEDAEFAFGRVVLPGIMNAIEHDTFIRKHMHIVILDPAITHTPGITQLKLPILYEYSIGKEAWTQDYASFAEAKATLAWRTDRSSREVKTSPHLFLENDFPHSGAVNLDGIVVAVSGFEGYYDEMIAGMTALAIKGFANHAFTLYEKRADRPYLTSGDR